MLSRDDLGDDFDRAKERCLPNFQIEHLYTAVLRQLYGTTDSSSTRALLYGFRYYRKYIWYQGIFVYEVFVITWQVVYYCSVWRSVSWRRSSKMRKCGQHPTRDREFARTMACRGVRLLRR